jgi:hypothetical protein
MNSLFLAIFGSPRLVVGQFGIVGSVRPLANA